MVHRHLPQFETVTRCGRSIPCQVCEERDRGCTLKCAHDYREAAEALSRQAQLPDLVVLDLHFALPEDRLLPEDKSQHQGRRGLEELRRKQGLHILERLRRDYPTLPVVLLTTTDADFEKPQGQLVYFCENEVVDSRTLAAEITRALDLQHASQEGPVFWGRGAAMAALRRQIGVLSRSPLPVLIEGETGTGKSYLAEHVLHPRSGAKGPLVITDLSTIPSTLLPAHLFGARRGSYTGAVEDQAGVFEQAHGGTLFLDEIANLDLELQRQLLLVLERGTVTRLGDVRQRPAAPRGPARPGPLRPAGRAPLGCSAAAGAGLPRPLPHARRLPRGHERGGGGQAAGLPRAAGRVHRVPLLRRAAAPVRARLARQPARAQALRLERAGVRAGAAPRCRGRRARSGAGGALGARPARRPAPGVRGRAAVPCRSPAGIRGHRAGPPHRSDGQVRTQLRGDLRGRRAAVPRRPVPGARRRPGPHGPRAVRKIGRA